MSSLNRRLLVFVSLFALLAFLAWWQLGIGSAPTPVSVPTDETPGSVSGGTRPRDEPRLLLTGRALDARSRRPVAGAEVTVFATSARAVTGEDGTFELALELGPRDAEVRIESAAHLPASVTARLPQTPESTSIGDVLLVAHGTLDVRVVAASGGGPLEGADVSVRPFQVVEQGGERFLDRAQSSGAESHATGSSGVARFERLAPGTYVVRAVAAGHAAAFQRVELAGGGQPHGVTLALRPGYRLEGRVTQEDGTPVPKATVRADVESGHRDRMRRVDAAVDARGAFAFDALPAGNARVAVVLAGREVYVTSVRVPLDGRLDMVVPDHSARITGVVIDGETGGPLGDVRIELRESGVVTSGLVASDATGRFEVTDLIVGRTYLIRAWKSGWRARLVGGRLPRVAPTSNEPLQVRIVMVPAGGVTGTVLEDGVPVAGARVAVLSPHGAFRDETGPDGLFAISGIPDGPVLVYAETDAAFAKGFPWEAWTEHLAGGPFPATTTSVEEASTVDLTLELQSAGTVTGTVLSASGRPVAGAQVHTYAGPSPSTVAVRDTTGPDGRFFLRDVPSGRTVRVFVEADDQLAPEPTEVLLPPGGERDVELRLVTAPRVRGRVRAQTGELPPGTLVQVAVVSGRRDVAAGPVGAFAAWQGAPACVVAADGTFDVALPQANGDVVARASTPSGTSVTSSRLRFAAGRDVDGVELVLPGAHTVRGRVLDAEGRPVAGAGVHVSGGRAGVSVTAYGAVAATTDAQGGFVVEGLTDGSYAFFVRRAPFAPASVRVAVPTDDEPEIRLFRAEAIAGRVVGPEGQPIAGLQVTARQAQPDFARNWEYAAVGARTTLSASDGAFRLGDLLPGAYEVEVFDGTDRTLSVAIVAVSGVAAGTRDLEVRVPGGEIITGTVQREDGGAAGGAQVVADGPEGAFRGLAEVRAAADGSFGMQAVREGPVDLRARWNHSGRAWVGGVQGVHPRDGEVRIVVRPAPVLRGRVLDDAGRPVAALQLRVGRARVRTQGDGRFRAALSEDGPVDVSIDPTDALAPSSVLAGGLRLVPGDDEHALRLGGGAPLTGVVGTAAAELPRGLIVRCSAGAWTAEARVRRDGGFRLMAPSGTSVAVVVVDAEGNERVRTTANAGASDVRLQID